MTVNSPLACCDDLIEESDDNSDQSIFKLIKLEFLVHSTNLQDITTMDELGGKQRTQIISWIHSSSIKHFLSQSQINRDILNISFWNRFLQQNRYWKQQNSFMKSRNHQWTMNKWTIFLSKQFPTKARLFDWNESLNTKSVACTLLIYFQHFGTPLRINWSYDRELGHPQWTSWTFPLNIIGNDKSSLNPKPIAFSYSGIAWNHSANKTHSFTPL